jgi:hypothetical protein
MEMDGSPTLEFISACNRDADEWVPANGGTETPFVKNGTRYLYVYNPFQQKHGMLNLDTDIVIDDKEYYSA